MTVKGKVTVEENTTIKPKVFQKIFFKVTFKGDFIISDPLTKMKYDKFLCLPFEKNLNGYKQCLEYVEDPCNKTGRKQVQLKTS